MNSTNTSSISSVSTNYRQKGKQPSVNAKLYKGFIHDASSKTAVGSIPAKFETIVFRNQSLKAFGSSNTRFQSSSTDVPGPQDYEFGHQFSIVQGKAEESLSRKGMGGFASSQERTVFQQKYINNGPGPGQYNEASFFNQSTQSSLMRSSPGLTKLSTALKKPSSSEESRVKVVLPGPGEYEVNHPRKINTYKSSFISRVQRDEYLRKQEVPAPGQYPIKRSFIRPSHNLGPSPSFYPEINHHKEETTQQRLMKFLEDPEVVTARQRSPGPCDYDPALPEFKPEYAAAQEMSSFKVQSTDRFGDPTDPAKAKDEGLGPGQYILKGQLETIAEEKTLVSGSAFMSECLRRPFGDFEKRMGPNTSIPYVLPRKKNYHLNLQRKWV